jgi:hypothetical protein
MRFGGKVGYWRDEAQRLYVNVHGQEIFLALIDLSVYGR